MKMSIFDIFILPFIILNACLSFFTIKFLIHDLSLDLFQAYSVVINIFLFLFLFAIFSVINLKTTLFFFPLKEGELLLTDKKATIWKLYSLSYMESFAALNPFSIAFFNPFIIKLFGATTGKGLAIAGHINEPLLVTIGDYSILGQNSVLTPHALISGKLILKKILIGKNVTIGVNSVIMPGVVVGDNSIILPNSVLEMNTSVGQNEIWAGAPAEKLKDISTTT